MPFLLQVNGRVGIMIHPGNYPKDTQGCILVGRNLAKGSVSNSKQTFQKRERNHSRNRQFARFGNYKSAEL